MLVPTKGALPRLVPGRTLLSSVDVAAADWRHSEARGGRIDRVNFPGEICFGVADRCAKGVRTTAGLLTAG